MTPENAMWAIYLVSRADAIHGLTVAAAVCCWLAVIVCLIMYADKCLPLRYAKISAIVAVVATLLATLMPTKTDLMYILGGGVVAAAAQSDPVRETTSKAYKLLQKFLDEQLGESK